MTESLKKRLDVFQYLLLIRTWALYCFWRLSFKLDLINTFVYLIVFLFIWNRSTLYVSINYLKYNRFSLVTNFSKIYNNSGFKKLILLKIINNWDFKNVLVNWPVYVVEAIVQLTKSCSNSSFFQSALSLCLNSPFPLSTIAAFTTLFAFLIQGTSSLWVKHNCYLTFVEVTSVTFYIVNSQCLLEDVLVNTLKCVVIM